MALGTDGLITVVGDFDTLDGSPVSGKVTVTPSVEIRRGSITYPQLPTVVPLDADGKFSIKLPASDDPAVTPNGFTYRFDVAVSASVAGRSVTDTSSTNFALPVASANTGGVAQLSTLAPAPEVGTPSVFLTRAVADQRYALKGESGGVGTGGPVTTASITDATPVGVSLVKAADAATARSLIGAGTSSLAIGTTSSTAAAGNHGHTSTSITDFVEAVQDALSGVLVGTGVTIAYDDANNRYTFTVTGGGAGGLDAEGAQDAVGNALQGLGLVQVAYNDAGNVITVTTTATANSTDAQLRDRSTHTGSQAASTIAGLATVATSGSYTDLTNKPAASGTYTDTQARAAVASVGYLSTADLEVATDVVFHPDLAKTFAGMPDAMFVGAIDRSDATRVRASVVWPDTATGSFVGVVGSTGGIDSYTITHVLAGATLTYAQPTMTRDNDGAVINRPAITVANGAPVTPVIPTAPTLSSSALTSSGVTISGTGGTNVASITLARGATQVATALPFVDSGLSASTAYTYTATVTSSTGNTATSSITVTTASAAVTAPTGTSTVTLGTATVTTQPLTFTAVSGATAYDVEHKASSGSTWTVDSTAVTGTSYTVTGLTGSTGYDYRVRARNSGGTGPYSTVKSATTAASGASATILADNFTAADGAIDGRVLPDGSNTTTAWSHLTTPSRMTIVSNTAKATVGYAAAFAVADTGVTAYKVAATFPALLPSTSLRRIGIIFRAQSDTNYFRADPNTGVWLVRKIIAGAATTLITGGTAAAGDVVEVTVAADNSITLRVNGVVSGTAVTGQTDLSTVTNAGIYGQFSSGTAQGATAQDATSSVDAFSVTTL